MEMTETTFEMDRQHQNLVILATAATSSEERERLTAKAGVVHAYISYLNSKKDANVDAYKAYATATEYAQSERDEILSNPFLNSTLKGMVQGYNLVLDKLALAKG